jgi:hypothetical protein
MKLRLWQRRQTWRISGGLNVAGWSNSWFPASQRLRLALAAACRFNCHAVEARDVATQFFGFLNSPVQIRPAREMAQAKGSDVPDSEGRSILRS